MRNIRTLQFPIRYGLTIPLWIESLERTVAFLVNCLSVTTWEPLVIFTMNLDHWYRCHRDDDFYQIYQKADGVVPDGWPISRMASRLAGQKVERIPGVDLLIKLITSLESRHRVFLLGAAPGVAERAAEKVHQMFHFRGEIQCHHGYFIDADPVRRAVLDFRPHLLVVGMGSPRQERWLVEGWKEKPWRLALAVGGAIDVLAGIRPRAPGWIQKLGMEWFYRWCQRPIRLTRRYYVDGPRAYVRLQRVCRMHLDRASGK